ncbi:MAG: CoA-binding protein [Bacteroidia bacterium]
MTTLILGASENAQRYSYKAAHRLVAAGFDVLMVGKQQGSLLGRPIHKELPYLHPKIDTVTLYLNPQQQEQFHETILKLQPRRVIFNPGTEHFLFMKRLQEAGIEAISACTLVMLAVGDY